MDSSHFSSKTNNSKCACKGIRRCLLCEPITLSKESPSLHSVDGVTVKQYFFCPHCEYCYESKTESSRDHHEHKKTKFNVDKITVVKDFINPVEETDIIRHIGQYPWKPSQSGRLKQDFGPKVNFKKKKVSIAKFNGLPNFTSQLLERMTNTIEVLAGFRPVEVCNLHYVFSRGASIDAHIDDAWLWGERLVTLSLGSDTYLTLTHHNMEGIEVLIPMPARSLLVLQGDARHNWKHSIKRQNLLDDRMAVTFRELSTEFCEGGLNQQMGDSLLEIAQCFDGQPLYNPEVS